MGRRREGHRKRILLLEDDDRWCRMLELVFRDRGHDVEIAKTVEDCWQSAVSRRPDLIVIDIIMPAGPKQGLELARRFAAEPTTKQIPRVFFTVVGEDMIEEEATPLSKGVFTKPLGLSRLVAEADRILSR